MSPNHVLVFGGTSDAVEICRMLEQYHIRYTLSVATPEGEAAAQSLTAPVIQGRMDSETMCAWIVEHRVDCVIDAAHPYAQILRETIVNAGMNSACPVIRYERPALHDFIEHPLVIRVGSIAKACQRILPEQQKILLTTGSKDLALFSRLLTDKTLYARVLPTSGVVAECESLGLGSDQIIAMKGPFSAAMNHALYDTIQPDVVITKESGQAGGFAEKVAPCIELGMTCIVIERPPQLFAEHYAQTLHSVEACGALFYEWKQKECTL
ncbi:precorrin-6A reductase [Vibrio mangrovi]|uniref:Precorrin-6A reductase n=1 Tax=Vibrio mangrovi TaxID=474394 RepID=A0A1Y6IY47_9VIBR|nr:precorrin-6A reductase [Vibrio mangrovi]MDW6005196.1 precorrin-6A reductase [Vibrio mangrovi]SMS02595.1 Precorrin-6A reductase [Vibrio mangrovi]